MKIGQLIQFEPPSQEEDPPPPAWDDLPALATVEEMTSLLRVTKKTLYSLLEEEEPPGCRKVGRSWRISVPAFRRWYESGFDGGR